VEETLSRVPSRAPASIEEVLEIDQKSRGVAREVIASKTKLLQEERGPVSVRA